MATQAATRLTKLPALPRLGKTYGYVFSHVNAPDERWVYDFITRHMSHHGKSAQVIEQSVYYTIAILRLGTSTSGSHSVDVCVVRTRTESIRSPRNVVAITCMRARRYSPERLGTRLRCSQDVPTSYGQEYVFAYADSVCRGFFHISSIGEVAELK